MQLQDTIYYAIRFPTFRVLQIIINLKLESIHDEALQQGRQLATTEMYFFFYYVYIYTTIATSSMFIYWIFLGSLVSSRNSCDFTEYFPQCVCVSGLKKIEVRN